MYITGIQNFKKVSKEKEFPNDYYIYAYQEKVFPAKEDPVYHMFYISIGRKLDAYEFANKPEDIQEKVWDTITNNWGYEDGSPDGYDNLVAIIAENLTEYEAKNMLNDISKM